MEKGLYTHISKGDIKHLPGRDAIWLQTPETTGGKYTTVSTTFYQPGVKVAPAARLFTSTPGVRRLPVILKVRDKYWFSMVTCVAV